MRVLPILFFMIIMGCMEGDSSQSPSSLSHSSEIIQNPIDDALIVGGTGNCNPNWNSVDIKNNSSTKFLTVTVQKQTQIGSSNPVRTTSVYERMAPKEQKNLGCKGCGQTTTGRYCTSFKVLAAVYVE